MNYQFGFNLFRTHQEFIALYVCLFAIDQLPHALRVMRLLLSRSATKAPLAFRFTYDYFTLTDDSAKALSLLRFVSMLGDVLGKGCLRDQLVKEFPHEGELISEVRHALTHKQMVSPALISRIQKILFERIKVQFWHRNFILYGSLAKEKILIKTLERFLAADQKRVAKGLAFVRQQLRGTLSTSKNLSQLLERIVKEPLNSQLAQQIVTLIRGSNIQPGCKSHLRRIQFTAGIYQAHRRITDQVKNLI